MASPATHAGLIWLGSSMEKRFSQGCRSHHVLVSRNELPAFIPDMLLRRVMLVLGDVWEFAAHLQQYVSELFIFHLDIIFQGNYSLSPFHTSCRQRVKMLSACLESTIRDMSYSQVFFRIQQLVAPMAQGILKIKNECSVIGGR